MKHIEKQHFQHRILSIVLSLALLLTLVPSFTITAHASGDLPNANGATGSSDRPFIINEASDFG